MARIFSMKKILFSLLGLTILLCGCHYEKSYFYELGDLNNKIDVYYFIDIDKSDTYLIYINYFVDDINKWGETIDLIRTESNTGKYKSSISIFDENNKLIYSITEYPIRLHHHSSNPADRVISVDAFPKYFYLEKGRRYYFKINIDNIDLSSLGNYRKQIEITLLYKAK